MKHTKTILCTGLALVLSSNAMLIHADEPTTITEKQPLFFNAESKPVNPKDLALTIQKGHRKFITS
ncbi:hypothetical protein PT076_08600, partial [Erysipelothrix rhusiopathiae]|nr:hypothetical protein [Erysipelothrix rhusiopathiae]